MATYTELRGLVGDSELRNRIEVAVAVAAQAIIDDGGATTAQQQWAVRALGNPSQQASLLLKYLLAKNNTMTVDQIKGVSDSALQTAVDAAVPTLVSAG